MTTASAARRWFSQSIKAPSQCLLQPSQTLYTSLVRSCSTSVHKHPVMISLPSSSRQPRSLKSSNINHNYILNTFTHEPLLKARRRFSTSTVSLHNALIPPKPGEGLHITFVDKDGNEHTFEVAKGDNLLDIAQENDIEMEGACGGSCACSTCHVIVEDEEMYNKMDEPDDDENDMLDLAFGLTETSRLGCQVKMSRDLDGLRVKLPAMTRNLQASDFSKRNERSD